MDGVMNPAVAFYFDKAGRWQAELAALRRIVLACGLTEKLKWGVPCYSFQEGNVVLLHVFKEYCAILFVKGALLHDTNGILVQQTENTQASRQLRFTSLQQLAELEPIMKAYIHEAIEGEKAGLEVVFKQTSEFNVPEEFHQRLAESLVLKTAFEALTPGRQRAYLLYFSAPKQAKTREARIEKCRQPILNGKGLHD